MSKYNRTAQFIVSQKDHEWLYIFRCASICLEGVRAHNINEHVVVFEVDEQLLESDKAEMRQRGANPQTTFRQAVEHMQYTLQIMEDSGFHCTKSVIPAFD